MKNVKKKPILVEAFTLVEVLVVVVVSAILSLGAYQLFIKSTSQSISAASKLKKLNESERVLDQITQKIRNIPFLNDSSTPLLINKSSLICSDLRFASSLVSFPGISRENMPSKLNNPFDPSSSSIDGISYDAIRVVSISTDSQILQLAINPGTGTVFSTNDSNKRIVVENPNELSVGDFAFLIDTNGSRFFRVTNVQSGPIAGTTSIVHGDISIWNSNRSISRDYGIAASGEGLSGGASVLKASVDTYAYSPQTNKLYLDSHERDDGFDPISGKFFRITLANLSMERAARPSRII